MQYLGIIPARGGSKGIPRKNLFPLHGNPLLAYTAKAALGSTLLSRVILSTDDEEIAKVGASLGLDVPFLRPRQLSLDTTPILPVIAEILARVSGDAQAPDAIVLLQPTSPLRTSEHIDDALRMFDGVDADSLVSVMDVPHQFHPSCLMEERDGYLIPLSSTAPVRRQDKSALLARNGPAILVSRFQTIMGGSLYGQRIVPYRMDEESSVDIDSYSDLQRAEFLLTRAKGAEKHPVDGFRGGLI